MVQNNSDSESFESLLNESLMRQDNFSVGDEVTGKVVQLTGDSVFVDISGKSEAIIERGELADKDGNLTVKLGDTIKAFIVAMRGGEIRLTARIGKGSANLDLIEKAKEFNIPVEGTVTTVVKGGYRVSVSGIECFCPLSQMDVKGPASPETMLHRSFSFKVTQITEHGRNIVLSRRQLLEERQREREQELRATLKEGALVTGTVSSIQKFGVFLDLDGMDALIPRTELSWARNADPASFAPGQTLTVKVLSIDWEARKFVLSLRHATQEPWERIGEYSEGQQVTGKITNIIKSGAFFELEPGIEGFIPVSRMSLTRRVNRPEDAVAIGSTVTVNIIEINREAKRIS
ncbi:MAG: S1 RNA-binding domain-containing protein, partial [Spirochaetes bacterium]